MDDAAIEIKAWIDGSQVRTLNVAGPGASEDPKIHQAFTEPLQTVFF